MHVAYLFLIQKGLRDLGIGEVRSDEAHYNE
jgi:hypothetical protein